MLATGFKPYLVRHSNVRVGFSLFYVDKVTGHESLVKEYSTFKDAMSALRSVHWDIKQKKHMA